MNDYQKALYLIYTTDFNIKKVLNMIWNYKLTTQQFQDIINRMVKRHKSEENAIKLLATHREVWNNL